MRVSDKKQISKNYTGVVLVGQYQCGYIPAKEREFKFSKFKDGMYKVAPLSHRRLSLLYTSILEFVKKDFDQYAYKYWSVPYWDDKNRYFLILEFYVHGDLKVEFTFSMDKRVSSTIPNMVTILTTMISMLSNISDEQDIKVEYIGQYEYFPKETSFYNTNIGQFTVYNDKDQATLCISYSSENNERSYLCTYGRVATRGQDFYFSIYLYRGYGVNTGSSIYVCLEDEAGLKVIVLKGRDNPFEQEYRKLIGLSLSDVLKLTDTL